MFQRIKAHFFHSSEHVTLKAKICINAFIATALVRNINERLNKTDSKKVFQQSSFIVKRFPVCML